MNSLENGKDILKPEITNISEHDFWILLEQKEYFLSFGEYPWFLNSKISSLINVKQIHDHHLYRPDLDDDFSTEILAHPERYPLSYN